MTGKFPGKRQVTKHFCGVFYSSVGELYFKMEKLKNFAGPNQQSLAGFEKIRTVGKGKFTFLLHNCLSVNPILKYFCLKLTKVFF